jgi:hypothetical protein
LLAILLHFISFQQNYRFKFYRILPKKIYFVGGFGVTATWVDIDEYERAKPDVLATSSLEIMDKLNRAERSNQDLILVAAQLLISEGESVEIVRCTNVDRLGLDVRVTYRGAKRKKLLTDEYRIGFRTPVLTLEDAKSEIIKLCQEAWEKSEGITWGEEREVPGATIPIWKIASDDLGFGGRK